MRKTDKKIDNQLVKVLTTVCEVALKEVDGFEWLTHLVNYSSFPKSLKVICVFDSNQSLTAFMSDVANKQKIEDLIQTNLLGMDIKLKNISAHIGYDSQEKCDIEHDGNWAIRLS